MTEKSLTALYRVQLRPEFTLDDAAAIIPYLKALGIGCLYTSPFLQAAPGSTHGYDVVDYHRVNEELGGQGAFDRLVKALSRPAGSQQLPLGLVMDLVPNHMSIHATNAWWWDVLKNGPSSRYASYFDIEFSPPGQEPSDWVEKAIIIPVLGDQYGRVLEAGEIQFEFTGQDFIIRYHDNVYPVDPGSLEWILKAAVQHIRGRANATAGEELSFLADAIDQLPPAASTDPSDVDARYRNANVLQDKLLRLIKERSAVRQAINSVVAEVNADPDLLDDFLNRQNYRLALWKISASQLDYRRFFDINSMIGICMEDEAVYRDSHELVVDLVRRGTLTGLRIDHPDGLRDPRQYLERLRGDAPDAWIVVEKILEPGEELPGNWPVQGTTGYDFLNRVNGLFVDPQAEAPLTEFYADFTGRTVDYPALVHEKKLLAATQILGSDLHRLTDLFLEICEHHRLYRDYTREELSGALAETAACLPVYRTYVTERDSEIRDTAIRDSLIRDPGTREESTNHESRITDQRINGSPIPHAIQSAKDHRPDLDPRLFDFLHDLLLLKERGPLEEDLVARFQQFSGPVMAKGVEDTAFYIYNRFISLNEVGGDPGRFGLPVDEFHRANRQAQAKWPLTLLATSTHDTKRSEDVRARLNVISEMPRAWMDAVRRWAEMNEKYRRGEYPDRNTEYLLYQTLAGAWPISADRAVEYMRKAGREAKEFTTWAAPNAEYEEAVESFVRAVMDDTRFTADLETFAAEMIGPGRINSLAQTLLKVTSPGVPDIYQGNEIWNLWLVDPDNRRPVDYTLRSRLLDSLADDTPPEKVLDRMADGLPKLWVIRQALALRQEHPDWFGVESSYTPLEIEQGVAFLRGENVLIAVPRLVVRDRSKWGESYITIPPGVWRSRLTHEVLEGGKIFLEALFARFPAALLTREEKHG